MHKRSVACPLVAIVFLSLVPVGAAAGQVIFLRSDSKNAAAQSQIELATRFYGLGLQSIDLQSESDVPPALERLRDAETLAVVAEADAIEHLQERKLLSALQRGANGIVPLLIVGVTPEVRPSTLQRLSGGEVSACRSTASEGKAVGLVVSADEVARQLAGVRLPALLSPACTFVLGDSRAKALLSSDESHGLSPIFVRAENNANQVFFLSELQLSAGSSRSSQRGFDGIFAQAAPFLMFVRYAAGENGWHSPGHYADLTIDDPWLTEPYGFLNYEALWAEMVKHNFHTTIAFIPWNYDRSDSRLVSFFRSHSDRLSIAVHGDNHDHVEFGTYDRKPLLAQTADIKQALARMERFRELTALDFDRVMVFPHEVVPPPQTLAKLNEYGFAAAPNAELVPLGVTPPSDPLFLLRAMNSNFGSFGLVRRYPAEVRDPKSLVAIHGFLDDPILFYCHQDFFTAGIGAFDRIADAVNQIQPDSRWDGLGGVARHLYLLKRKDDARYEVRDFSSDFILENKLERDATFYVEKAEDGLTPLRAVIANNQPLPYRISDGRLRFEVLVPKRTSARVVVTYQNDLEVSAVDVSKRSLYIRLLRMASDFRDITLSKYSSGRAITDFYYKRDMNALELDLERLVPFLLLLIAIPAAALYLRRAKARRPAIQRLPNRTSP